MGTNAIHFAKMHGLGNDFMVIDTLRQSYVPTAAQIQLWADRHRGVGFDQLLILTQPFTPHTDFGYRIFNADGQEVQQCGNGVRCLARYAKAQGLTTKNELQIATHTSTMQTILLPNQQVRVNMGHPNFAPSSLPFLTVTAADTYNLTIDTHEISFGAVSMGNPHIVIPVLDLETALVNVLGPKLMQHSAFPQGVNIGFMQIVNRDSIRLRVYERGAGETQACGSGACAAMAIAHQWQQVNDDITIELLGGKLQVSWAGDGHPLWMTGPAELVYLGEISI